MAEMSSVKAREKAVFVAQQLHFANTLAGNDPTHRARAMKKLRKYFIARANGNFSFTHDDFMRIWKGLFYCMWMSDKPLIQEELAEEISQLIHCFQHVDTALTFVQAFFDTLLVEWFGIDYHRIDKFQMFVRRFLRQSLVYCKNKGWKKVPVSGLCDVYESTILSPSKCANECGDISLIMHFSDIFVEELAKVGNGKLSKEIILMFLKPFMMHLAGQNDSRLLDVIRDRIFYCLIRQSPEGMEYDEKFEAWKRAGFPGTSWKEMVFVGKEDNRSGVKIKNLDPRAGKVNVYLPHLQFDAASVAKALQESCEMSSNKKTQRYIRTIARKFEELAEGRYPLTLNIPKTHLDSNKYRFSKQKIDEAVEDLLNFEEQLKKKDKDMKNNGKRKKNSSKLTKAKKMKFEISCADKEDNGEFENEKFSDVEDKAKDIDPPLARNDQTEESGPGILENDVAGILDDIDVDASVPKEHISIVDEEDMHGNEGGNSHLTKVTKRDKKKHNGSSWNVSEISSLGEKTPGIFQECKENKESEKENVLEKDFDEEIPILIEKNGFEETSLQNEFQDSNVKIVQETDVLGNTSPKEILHHPADTKPQDSFIEGAPVDSQEGDKNSKVSCELETDAEAKEVITPLRRSTRRRSNMVTTPNTANKKEDEITSERMLPTENEQTPFPKRKSLSPGSLIRGKRRINTVTTPNTVNEKEDEITSERMLPTENEQTPFPKRKSLSPGSLIRGKRRINTVPDREIFFNNESNELADSVNYIATNVPGSSDSSSQNGTCNGVLRNNDMLNKQGPSPSQKVFQTPGKKRVSLHTTPSSTKKVNIALQMNKTQAVSEYNAALKQSPSIPFDANKMPCKGVLKRTSMKSPINPFYVPPGKLQ